MQPHSKPSVTQELNLSTSDTSLNTPPKLDCEENTNNASRITNISNSLQMIGEAYISEDSQGSDEYNESENVQQSLRLDNCSKIISCKNDIDKATLSVKEVIDSSNENLQLTENAENADELKEKCENLELEKTVSSATEITSDEVGYPINLNLESRIESIVTNIESKNEPKELLKNINDLTEVNEVEESTEKNLDTLENQIVTKEMIDFEDSTSKSDLKVDIIEETTLKPSEKDQINDEVTESFQFNFIAKVHSDDCSDILTNSEMDLSLCEKQANDLQGNSNPSVNLDENIEANEKLFVEELVSPTCSETDTSLIAVITDNKTEIAKQSYEEDTKASESIPTILSPDPITEDLVIESSLADDSEKLSSPVKETIDVEMVQSFTENNSEEAKQVQLEILEALSIAVPEKSIDISKESTTEKIIEKVIEIKDNADQGLIKEECKVSIEVNVNVTDEVKENYDLNILQEGEGDEPPGGINTTSMERKDEHIPEGFTNILETMQCSEGVINKYQCEDIQSEVTTMMDPANESTEIESEENTEKKVISEELPQIIEELNEERTESDLVQNIDSFKQHLRFDLKLENDESPTKIAECLEADQESPQSKIQSTENIEASPLVTESSEEIINVSKDLEDGSKLKLLQDLLLESNVESVCINDAEYNSEIAISNPEISELESAVKFLQASEVQNTSSSFEESTKIVESVVDNESSGQVDSGMFTSKRNMCENSSEIVTDIEQIIQDPIAISEAEIISEAVKLESERKAIQTEKESATEKRSLELPMLPSENISSLLTFAKLTESEKDSPVSQVSERLDVSSKLTENEKPGSSESVSKVSVLEERLKEPPKIVIPNADIVKVFDTFSPLKTSLLMQKDTKANILQKMDSPKGIEKIDTPRKDSEKSDSENVGSPRIILKIAKSAIADCVEPKSPKSPKIRSAANSPNPDDSPGQKLGKIKLKLSKSGHPSIIPNENFEEASQWHTESTSSLSPIGMKIKFSKSGEASVIQSEKVEDLDTKEVQQKSEHVKKSETSFGMKIKLLKTGDASIIQGSKEILPKLKEKAEVMQQDGFKKSESPIGMKIKLSKVGDPSIIQPEKQFIVDEGRDGMLKGKEKLEFLQDGIKRTESPLGMKIKLSKSGDASIVSSEYSEEPKEVLNIIEKRNKLSEIPGQSESPIAMKIKLTKTKGGASIVSVDKEEDLDKLEISNIPKRTDSPLGMKIKLSKSGDASIIHQDCSDEVNNESTRQRVKSEVTSELTKHTDPAIGVKIKVSKSGEATILHCKSIDASNIQSEQSEYLDELKVKEYQLESSKKAESPIGMKIKLSKSGDASIVQTEISADTEGTAQDFRMSEKEENIDLKSSEISKNKQLRVRESAATSDTDRKEKQKNKEATKKSDEPALEMKIKLSKTGHPTIVACESYVDSSNKGKEVLSDLHNVSNRSSSMFQNQQSELTIEPLHSQIQKPETSKEVTHKRKDVTISSIESKKLKFESKISQILPEVTIQPVATKEQKQGLFDTKSGGSSSSSSISREQMHVISQEISITQVKLKANLEPGSKHPTPDEKRQSSLNKIAHSSPASSDCEIIEHRPELVIVNENSNSSQDVVIIEEVPPAARLPEVKVPKKRGRPRRNDSGTRFIEPVQALLPRDPLALDESSLQHEPRENERPRRTCRSQKSYAPPKRGRGGRGW